MVSLSECIPWITVTLAESVAIVTFNLCTIIVFIRNRYLRKRSTYLVMNLAVIDVFVGGVVVYNVFYRFGVVSNLWERHFIEDRAYILIHVPLLLFPTASLTNITIIALERVHATFFPLRHRVLKKWVYGLIIAVVWVTSCLVSVSSTLLIAYHIYLLFTFISICLVIICVSYASVVIKVRCGAQPQHHGAASREKKLTMTLLIVTVVSLLLYLPFVVIVLAIHISKSEVVWSEVVWSVPVPSFYRTTVLLLYANSVVNPIVYAIRMPEYRSAFFALFRRRAQQQRQVAVLPLRNM